METENNAESLDLLNEPLVAPATPSSSTAARPTSNDPTPLRSFWHSDVKSEDEDLYGGIQEEVDGDDDDADTANTTELETKLQLRALRILGKPYGKSFWLRAWPVAALLGALLGLGTLLFLAAAQACLRLWFPLDNVDSIVDKDYHWLTVTMLGGLVCGILLLLPKAPRVGTVRTMFHDAGDLQGNPVEAIFIVLACLVCLGTGAPLGPEMAIGAFGSGLASFLSRVLQADRRTEAGWVFGGMAGSLGGLFPSPILGVTLVHELSVVGRPDAITLDAVASKQRHRDEEQGPLNVSPVDPDYGEQITLAGTAATCAYMVLHALVPSSFQWHRVLELGNDYHMWHVPAAIVLGLLCGTVTSFALILLGAFRTIRKGTCEFLEEELGSPKWIGRLLFPVMAGALHGLLTIYNPYLVGSGMTFVPHLIEKHDTMQPGWLLFMAICKTFSMSMCLGFGLVGGPLFPMVFVGLCVGLACSAIVPISFSVPCSIAATVGAFVPIPFTLVVYVTLAFSLTAEQMGPVFVATFVAYALTGGTGVIRRLGERRLGVVDDWMVFEDAPHSDQSILHGIRQAIFGSS